MSTASTSQQLSPQLAAIVRELEDVSLGWKKLVGEIGQQLQVVAWSCFNFEMRSG